MSRTSSAPLPIGADAAGWAVYAEESNARVHLYGKREARVGRKMGHVTCLGVGMAEALATARAIKRDLGIPGADEL